MAINIKDSLRKKAVKLLEDEQIELVGAYDKQAVRGVSPGMESEFIPETAKLAQGRTEKRIAKDSKGKYTQEEVFVEQTFYDETVVENRENKFREDAETLQEVCRAYDNEMIRLNGLINDIKVQIVNLSNEAGGLNCWPGTAVSTYTRADSTTVSATIRYQRETQFNNEVEKIKIYPKMAGPQYNPGVENPFEPDSVINLTSAYAGFGYENIRDNNNAMILDNGNLTVAGAGLTAPIDGSGSGIGIAQLGISTVANHHKSSGAGGAPGIALNHTYSGAGGATGGATEQNRCATIAQDIEDLYLQIPPLRRERDQYRKKLNAIKVNKKEKELSHWGYQNTKNEVNIRKTKNISAIGAINELDSSDGTLDSSDPNSLEPGLVLYFDAADNSSYFGSGTTWFDISNDDYDDNGNLTTNEFEFIEDPVDDQRNYFRFAGGSGPNNVGDQSVSFDITDTVFGDPDTVTVEMLAQITADSSFNLQDYGGMMFGWYAYEVWFKTPEVSDPLPGLGFNAGSGSLVGITPERVETLLLNNEVPLSDRAFDVFPAQWAHYTFVMHKYDSTSGVSVKDQLLNNKIYINGVSESIEELRPSGTYNSGYMNFNNGAGKICGRVVDNSYNLPQEVALFRVYNKELTQAEITANYNEVKGRFGLV
jgi:hypothetical protein